MNIGIIGKGNVARALGARWSHIGHSLLFGVRDPRAGEAADLPAPALTVREVFARTDVVLLAVRWDDVEDVLGEAESLDGKILIDCITPMERGTHKPLLSWDESVAERIARLAPGARVVKCFDTAGVRAMQNPVYGDEHTTMFLCGDSAEAKGVVRALAEDLGFDCCDAGPLSASRYLEALSAFWVHLAFDQKLGKEIAFRLLNR